MNTYIRQIIKILYYFIRLVRMESRIFAAVNVLETFSLVYSIVLDGERSLTLPAVNDTLRLYRIRFLHFEWRKNVFFYVALGMRIMYLTSDRRRNENEKKKRENIFWKLNDATRLRVPHFKCSVLDMWKERKMKYNNQKKNTNFRFYITTMAPRTHTKSCSLCAQCVWAIAVVVFK